MNERLLRRVRYVSVAALLLAVPSPAAAQTEFHIQYGSLDNPFSGQSEQTVILTFQHALSWSLGDSFFFTDFIDDVAVDGFNDRDFYGEWYPTLSLGKLANRKVGAGRLRDIALIGGINFGGDADFFKYLPGVRASWDVPGFYFLNTDVTAFIDANTGARKGERRAEDQQQLDVRRELGLRHQRGQPVVRVHGVTREYIGGGHRRVRRRGEERGCWLQPQFMWDIGKAVANKANQIFLGIEYQYWLNKLGTDLDENTAQLLIVWRL